MTDYGATDTSTTTLGANQFPNSSVFVPGDSKLTVLGGANKQTDGNGKTYAEALLHIADGSDVTQGASTDANTANTVMGRLTKIRDLLNTTLAVTQSGTWNITNISGTISLPTGASTSAKQPALGTAGTASADVLSVQGIASMTALKVDGSAVTQPVSLTSTTVTGTVAVTESGVWNIRNQDGAGNALTTNSTTYTAKFGLDSNLLGTLGTAFSTAGKVDVKGADGDVFVRQATGSNLHAVLDAGSAVIGHVIADSGSTTAVTGTVSMADGSGNALTTNSSTFTAKKALDANILGTLGTAFSTAGKVDVKAAANDIVDLGTLAGGVTSSKYQTNLAQVAGTTTDTNSGTKSAGTQRMVIATDQPALTNAQPANVTQVAGNSIATGNNAMPVLNAASTGYVAAYGSNASALTSNTDYVFKWGAGGTTQVNHVMIQNNSSININWDEDVATNAGSPLLSNTLGQNTLFLDVQTTAIHIQGAGTPNVGGSSSGNIVIKGWL